MAVEPTVNPNYFKVKLSGDAWIQRVMEKDEKWGQRNSRVDLCYLASMWAPYADEDALRMMLDWNHWVGIRYGSFEWNAEIAAYLERSSFSTIVKFDEGHLKWDLAAAKVEIEGTLAVLTEAYPPIRMEDDKLKWMFQRCWFRLKKIQNSGAVLSNARRNALTVSKDMQQRWRHTHCRYFDGLIEQVKQMKEGRMYTRSVKEYIEMRRGTIGVYPAIALTEYGLNTNVPPDVFGHPLLQECMRISADLVLLVNDVLSYRKDLALGVDHNLITLVQEQGGTVQDAMDKIGEMIHDCYRRWYRSLADLPNWGEKIDREVLRFVDGCRNVALGNLYWR
ncbi:MAG: hypothetical protein Q9219_003608 [cf. Caloplaca sp. 3 TL-2023]